MWPVLVPDPGENAEAAACLPARLIWASQQHLQLIGGVHAEGASRSCS